jgi:agmatine deiminase
MSADTPHARKMPAEWSPHLATWLSWPHNPDTWPGLLTAAELAMSDVVAALAECEVVHVNVQDASHALRVERLLERRAPSDRFVLHHWATDDAWIRDYGAIVVRDAAAPRGFAALDFDYNAWGDKYPPYDNDRGIAARMAAELDLPCVPCGMVLEGGSIDVNGAGLALVTEQCLLNPNRNPGLNKREIETRLRELFGLDRLLWLGGGIVGDDTDGHIDNLSRFVAERCVVTIVETQRADPNYQPLAENLVRLRQFEDADGALEIVELPMPDPQLHDGTRLPASYANFYIANEIVLMPSYGSSKDDIAAAILADCFPGRRVQPIDCRALVAGLGALHCLTQQIPVMVAASEPPT